MNNEVKYWILSNHKLFNTLNRSQIKELCVIKNFRKAQKEEIIYFANDDVKKIYILTKGMIKISQTDAHGHEIIRDIIHQGDLFGEIALNSENAQETEYAQALSKEIIICSFRLDDFEKLISENPALALSYTKIVGLKLKRLENKYSNLVFKDVRSRLVAFLREWAQREGVLLDGKYTINNYLTQEEMGKIICATRQTVTEMLNQLHAEGQINYDRKVIEINKIETLK